MNYKNKPAKWQKIIADLREVGYTIQELADACDSFPSTLGDLATGRSSVPRGDLALSLYALHQKTFSAKKA